jgi:hypothetical protein
MLFNVAVNGLLQERDVDYFHIAGTSKITFATAPVEGSIITITYYKGRNSVFIDSYGKTLQVATEYFTFNGSSLTFTLSNAIDSVVSLDINGLIEEEGQGFDISASNQVKLNFSPTLGSKIGVTYVY